MKIIMIVVVGVLVAGCSLLPYKTDFTCPNAIGGKCGNALESFNDSLKDVSGNKIENSEYIRNKR